VTRLLVSRLTSAVESVAKAEQKAYDAARQAYRQHRNRSFEVDDYVLIQRPTTDKLDTGWRGPFLVVRKENPVVFVVKSVVNDQMIRVHQAQMVKFYPGDISVKELKQLALLEDEFLVDEVLDLCIDADGTLQFLIHWFGFGPEHNSWTAHHDFSNTEMVLEYLKNTSGIVFSAEFEIFLAAASSSVRLGPSPLLVEVVSRQSLGLFPRGGVPIPPPSFPSLTLLSRYWFCRPFPQCCTKETPHIEYDSAWWAPLVNCDDASLQQAHSKCFASGSCIFVGHQACHIGTAGKAILTIYWWCVQKGTQYI